MCYFFINILKIAVSARHSVIIYQISTFVIAYFCVAISLYCSAIFVDGCARLGFVPSSRRRVPSLRYWYSHSRASAENFSGGGNGKTKTEKYTNKPSFSLSVARLRAQWAYAQGSTQGNAASWTLSKTWRLF